MDTLNNMVFFGEFDSRFAIEYASFLNTWDVNAAFVFVKRDYGTVTTRMYVDEDRYLKVSENTRFDEQEKMITLLLYEVENYKQVCDNLANENNEFLHLIKQLKETVDILTEQRESLNNMIDEIYENFEQSDDDNEDYL